VLVLAQQIVVQTPPDTLGRLVSVLALVVAVTAAWVTYWQGKAIRSIETEAHEWQKVDRVSASIEVTAHRDRLTYLKDGRPHRDEWNWLRLRNSGRVPARDVQWRAEINVLNGRDSLEILHPGEHYDVDLVMALGMGPGWLFSVAWTDDRGRQETERRISVS
jgi:hypothetical protein